MKPNRWWVPGGLSFAALALMMFNAFGQSSSNIGTVLPSWTLTGFPLYGVAVTPTDDTALAQPMTIRPDADGAVTATCAGQGLAGTAITLTLVAGEFFPCQVIEVLDTGTDAITIHGFY